MANTTSYYWNMATLEFEIDRFESSWMYLMLYVMSIEGEE